MSDKFVKTLGHFFHEIESVFDTIKETKKEISLLGQDEIKKKYINDATNQLDAIVASTEDASNTIMEAAETIEELVENVDEVTKESVFNEITKIFEACSFQDLTGQRVGKVVEALKIIEDKIENMMRVFSKEIEIVNITENEIDSKVEFEPPQKPSTQESSLEGPQLPGEANAQDAIDEIFHNADK